MNEINKHAKSLELDKILKMLADKTACEDAAELAKNIKPSSDLNSVKELLKETKDAYDLMGRFGSPSFGGVKNVSNSLRRAQSGGVLTMRELMFLHSTLKTIRVLKEWKKHSDFMKTSLDDMFDVVVPNKRLENKIGASIVSEEEVADEASPELLKIRTKIKRSLLGVREKLDKMTRSRECQKYLQDPIVTIRADRFVLPVRAEYRANVPGIVHDTSASGSTVFVEPMTVVEANNDIRVLRSKEKDEIDRILAELSSEAGEFADEIIKSYDNFIKINLIFAKASLAYSMKAVLPDINDNGRINLKSARHPLIDKDKVVPTDINLGKEFDTLVITGPNTGGKTVSLKTIGLLSLMAMCGLMIPTADNSEISVFDNVLADIGDEQSIEQSLSTFSSHIVNIIDILKISNNKTLVLLDELGAGTDPIEGAALAISILEKLRSKGVKIAATTHYAELKTFALETEGVENGSCEFDIKTLRPTYKLLIGVPGKSNAFAISKRLGLDLDIVDRAKEIISDESTKFEDILEKLEKSRQELEREKIDAIKSREEADKVKLESEKLMNNIKRNAEAENKKAQIEARNIVARAREQAQNIINELEGLKKDKKELDFETKAKLKAKIREMENQSDPVKKVKKDGYKLPRKLKIGDEVLIIDLDKKAVVLEEEDNSGKVLVKAGIIKTRVSVSNLKLLKTKTNSLIKQKVTKNVAGRTSSSANTTIDVRGKDSLEAIIEIDNFIDSAILAGINNLTIIHGKGTGVLRKEIGLHLKKHPAVKNYRLGVFGEGESGVTVLELK